LRRRADREPELLANMDSVSDEGSRGGFVLELLKVWNPLEDYFAERATRASLGKAKRVLRSAGRDKPPLAGDEL